MVITLYGMELNTNVLSSFNTLYPALNCSWIPLPVVELRIPPTGCSEIPTNKRNCIPQ